MTTGLDIPAYIERSKIGEFPLGYAWGTEQYELGHDWITDGSRSAIVRKLEPLSVRAILGLLAASGEWLVNRLQGSGDPLLGDLVTAMWVGAVDPRLVSLTDPYPDSAADPAKGPLGAYARTLRYCYDIALEFDGAFHSYAESGLRLVDYVMPNAAYRTWRRTCYSRLATLTSSFAMNEVDARLTEQMNASGEKYTSNIVERLLAADKLDELWGPAVPREAYDPNASSGTTASGELLATLLRHAGASSNPFLRPPALTRMSMSRVMQPARRRQSARRPSPAIANAGHGQASRGASGHRASHGSANFSRPSTRSNSSFSAASVPGCAVQRTSECSPVESRDRRRSRSRSGGGRSACSWRRKDSVGRAVPLLVLRVSLDEHDALLSAGHPFFAPRADRDRGLSDHHAGQGPRTAGNRPL